MYKFIYWWHHGCINSFLLFYFNRLLKFIAFFWGHLFYICFISNNFYNFWSKSELVLNWVGRNSLIIFCLFKYMNICTIQKFFFDLYLKYETHKKKMNYKYVKIKWHFSISLFFWNISINFSVNCFFPLNWFNQFVKSALFYFLHFFPFSQKAFTTNNIFKI